MSPAGFQYSLCRIVYCCLVLVAVHILKDDVSIFALSNRVLLRTTASCSQRRPPGFNIRSVESCTAAHIATDNAGWPAWFQYSLCRIVYCCAGQIAEPPFVEVVSIFALSNRVLLLLVGESNLHIHSCFNIRSVESCTAAASIVVYAACVAAFQYSLCRIVYCCLRLQYPLHLYSPVSIFALSNRVLLLNR